VGPDFFRDGTWALGWFRARRQAEPENVQRIAAGSGVTGMTRRGPVTVVCMVVATLVGGTAWVGAAGATDAPRTPKLVHLWNVRLIGPGSTPVIAGGKVYLTAESAKKPGSRRAGKGIGSALYAFGAACAPAPAACPKSRVWQRSYAWDIEGYPVRLSQPAVGDGDAYVGTVQAAAGGESTGIDGVSAGAGTPTFSSGPGSTFPPTVSGPDLYADWTVFGGEGALEGAGTEAMNAATGAPLFTTPPVPYVASMSAPAVAGSTLFVASGSTLNAFDAAVSASCSAPPDPSVAGVLGFPEICPALWSAATGGTIAGTPTVAGGEVYVGGSNGVLSAFSESGCGASTCTPDWTATVGGSITSAVAVSGTKIFVASTDGVLEAFPIGGCGSPTCRPVWRATIGAMPTGPAADGNDVYVASSDGWLEVFAAAGCGSPTCAPGYAVNVHRPVDTAPAAGGGVVFVTDAHRGLHAYREP